MQITNDNWDKVLGILQSTIMPAGFKSRIKPLKVSEDMESRTITLIADDEMTISFINNRYLSDITAAVKRVYGSEYNVNIKNSSGLIERTGPGESIVSDGSGDQSGDSGSAKVLQNDDSALNPKYKFESFVTGPNNELAFAASEAVAKNTGGAYNPLFIYGNSGLGKTHLMHAIGHYVMQNEPEKYVLYISSEMFTNELVNAIQSRKMEEFRTKYRSVDVLMIDDIQFIEKKDSTQEEIFHTFNALYEAHRQIVISSDRPPKEIKSIDNRLRSRFEWGLSVDIKSPDYETRIAILKNKAEMEDFRVTDDMLEIFDIIATKITANIRELEGALNRVIAHATLTKKPLTRETAREVLTDVFSTSSGTIDANLIKSAVCSRYNITVEEIESSKRTKALAFPRQIAMYLCRELTDLSLPKIGESFGNRDHTTVMHACDKISKQMETDNMLRSDIEDLKSGLNGS